MKNKKKKYVSLALTLLITGQIFGNFVTVFADSNEIQDNTKLLHDAIEEADKGLM
ncbi:TPA: hypothetical protein KL275_002655, partial [Enterococcus faecalis]|nr:hypothetical protein [Enterococcus faecalis]